MNAIVTTNHQQFGFGDLERMARAVAASGLFGITKPDQALSLMLVAQAEGMHPATAARDYHIIQGRPAKKADAMLRDFLSAGGKVEWHTLTDEQADATFSHPAGGSARIDWTFKRATTAGIANPMWKKYPRQMLRSRVVSEGVRTVCPGATSGMYVPEEVQDIVAEQAPRAAPPEEHVDDAEFAPIIERKKAAQCKRDGDDETMKKLIAGLDAAGLDAFEEDFDEKTAHLPFSWLDPVRDMIASRRIEIAGEAAVAAEEAELDAGFSGTVAEPGAGSVAGRRGHRESAAA